MKTITRILTGLLVIGLGASLLMVQSDREFITLPPTLSQEQAIVLESGKTYSQEFRTDVVTISQIGLYFRPIQPNLPNETITVMLTQGSSKLASATSPTILISGDPNEALFFNFKPAVKVDVTQPISLSFSIPASLSRKMSIGQREQDETFNTDAKLYIDNTPQQDPLAYRVFFQSNPAISLHIGALLILAGIFILLKLNLKSSTGQLVYATGLAITSSAALINSNQWNPTLFILQFLLIIIGQKILGKIRIPHQAKLLTINTTAFTSTWALALVGRWWVANPSIIGVKEIFFDPNQLALGGGGAYIGVIAGIFILVAFITALATPQPVKKKIIILALATVMLFGSFTVPLISIIPAVILIAIGVTTLQQFLGEKDRLVQALFYTIVILSLLDLLQVQARIVLGRYFI